MLEFKTSQLKTRKRVLIDDHEYIVRNLGNIEQLEISQMMRELNKYAKLEKAAPLSEEQNVDVDNLAKRMTDIFVDLFDDGGDQSKSRQLLKSLSESEISLMLTQIFETDDATTVS